MNVARPALRFDMGYCHCQVAGAVDWEGAVRVKENGKEIGRGYLEMTGYGEQIRVG
jgi:hypothetical protein